MTARLHYDQYTVHAGETDRKETSEANNTVDQTDLIGVYKIATQTGRVAFFSEAPWAVSKNHYIIDQKANIYKLK